MNSVATSKQLDIISKLDISFEVHITITLTHFKMDIM